MSTGPSAQHSADPAPARSICRAALRRDAARLIELAHSLHAEPELAFAEHRSAGKITDLLAERGFTIEMPIAGLDTAFTASVGDGELVVALCAEYDALPGVGHACGHNLIAASSVGAALALAEVADEHGLTIRVIGTPAEEVGGGKVVLLDAGVFDDVAMAMMVHPAPEDVCRPRSLAIADVEVGYHGRGAHSASAPHLGVNAADAATVAQVAIGLLRQHLEPEQMLHGIVTDGGAAPNIVPEHAALLFNLRAADAASLGRLQSRLGDCFAAGALATGCRHEVRAVSPPYAELAVDAWLSEAYRSAITDLGRVPVSRAEERARLIGSTDMGNVTQLLPAIHPTIRVECGDAVNHQAEFAAACASESADLAVLDGANALAATTLAAAADQAQRSRLLAEVLRRTGPRARDEPEQA